MMKRASRPVMGEQSVYEAAPSRVQALQNQQQPGKYGDQSFYENDEA